MIESVGPSPDFFSLDMWLLLEWSRARPDILRGEMWRMGGCDLLEGEERCEARHKDLLSRLGSLITDTLLARAAILTGLPDTLLSHVKLCKLNFSILAGILVIISNLYIIAATSQSLHQESQSVFQPVLDVKLTCHHGVQLIQCPSKERRPRSH